MIVNQKLLNLKFVQLEKNSYLVVCNLILKKISISVLENYLLFILFLELSDLCNFVEGFRKALGIFSFCLFWDVCLGYFKMERNRLWVGFVRWQIVL